MWIKSKIKSKNPTSETTNILPPNFYNIKIFTLCNIQEFHVATAPTAPRPSHCRGTTITLRHITLVRLLWISVQSDVETSTWQHTTIKRDRQPRLRRDSNPQSQQAKRAAADPRLMPCGHWDLHCLRIHAVKNLLYVSTMPQKDKGLFQSEVYTQTHFLPQRQPTHSLSHRPVSHKKIAIYSGSREIRKSTTKPHLSYLRNSNGTWASLRSATNGSDSRTKQWMTTAGEKS